MSKNPSRRELLGVAAAGVAAVATPGIALAQTRQDNAMLPVEAELAKPLSPEARALLVESLKEVDKIGKDRLKHKLPENSEPCFSYAASPREVRAK